MIQAEEHALLLPMTTFTKEYMFSLRKYDPEVNVGHGKGSSQKSTLTQVPRNGAFKESNEGIWKIQLSNWKYGLRQECICD